MKIKCVLTWHSPLEWKIHYLKASVHPNWVRFFWFSPHILSIHPKGHFLGPWAYAQRFIFWYLSVRLKSYWAYAQRVNMVCTFGKNLHIKVTKGRVQLKTRTTNVVRNAGCARSRYTLKSSIIFLNQWLNESVNQLFNRVYLERLIRR